MIDFSPEQYGAKLHINTSDHFLSEYPIVIDVETDESDNFVGYGWTQNGIDVWYDTEFPEWLKYAKKIVAHNGKADLKWLINWGVKIKTEQLYFDTCLASYVHDTTKKSHSLKDLAKEYFNMEWPTYKEMVGTGKKKQTLDKQPIERVAAYNGMDVLATWKLYQYFQKTLTPQEKHYLETIELPTARVLLEMELKGTKVDFEYLKRLNSEFEERIEQLSVKIFKEARNSGVLHDWWEEEGEFKEVVYCACCNYRETEFVPTGKLKHKVEEFNVNSNVQIAKLLMAQGAVLPKTPKGNWKVDKKTLEGLKDIPVVPLLLEYSRIEKLKSTYTEALLEKQKDGRIYCNFNQISKNAKGDSFGIGTGRLCVHPDTLIEVPRDLSKYPDGVKLRDLKEGDWVYSLDWDKRLCLKKILWIGPTKKKETLKIKVLNKWGKITEFCVSKDHLVRMFKGEWKNAGSLKVGNRLCGFVRRGFGEYAYFFPSSKRRKRGTSGGRCKEHRWIYAQTIGRDTLPAKWDVHHKDENKLNNNPNNLDFMMHESHMKMHNKKITKGEIEEMIKTQKITVHPRTFKRKCKEFGLSATNHTIISIENIGEQELWDLEVEDTHTFFGGEVALHNSSSGPNLQNIPTRTEEGKLIRKAFITEEGNILLDADYSQIEPRLVAHISKDPLFLRSFKENRDIYQELVEGTGRDRNDGKTFMLALLYGAQPKKLASVFKCDEKEAEEIIKRIMSKLPGVTAWIERTKYEARQKKGVYTLFKRFIPLPLINSEDRYERMHWERVAVNSVVQGSAAEIMKIALIKLKEAGYVPNITVHDSFLIELTSVSEINYHMKKKIQDIMESAVKLDVPLKVSIGVGTSWEACKG